MRTTYRPPVQPAKKPAANNGMMYGLIGATIVAVAALVAAAVLTSQRAKMAADATIHTDAISGMATTLNVPLVLDGATPVDWSVVWADLGKAVSNAIAATTAAEARAAQAGQQIEQLEAAAAATATRLATTERAAKELPAKTAELDALKISSALQLTELRQQLADAKAELAKAQAAAEAPTEATPADEATTQPAAIPQEAPAATDAAVSEAAAPAEEEPASGKTAFAAGMSEILASVAYNGDKKHLVAVLVDGTKLVYKNVPSSVFETLRKQERPDLVFRMKVYGVYDCTPDDKAAIRALPKK